MSEQRISREDFDALWQAYLVFARQLREKDRHERGGTTLGEAAESGSLGDALVAVFGDPAYITMQVNDHLYWWLGERDVWGARRSPFFAEFHHPPGIAVLGKVGKHCRPGEQFPDPEEVGLRAARAPSMTESKATHRIAGLEELAALCLDLAAAFEARLENEGGIRRVQ